MNKLTVKKPTLYQATFSTCRQYRYEWSHRWADGDYVMFIGLNPSMADCSMTDPTVRRCISYAKRWGYGALHMTNLFAWIDTDPAIMKRQASPVGSKNDATLQRVASQAGLVVAAWGRHGAHMGRGNAVKAMIPNLHTLAVNKDGSPAHPLYLKGSLTPVPLP
jgi:hypothetical protein